MADLVSLLNEGKTRPSGRPSRRACSHSPVVLSQTISGQACSASLSFVSSRPAHLSEPSSKAPNDAHARSQVPYHPRISCHRSINQVQDRLSPSSRSDAVPGIEWPYLRLLARCMNKNQEQTWQSVDRRQAHKPFSARARTHGQSVDRWMLGLGLCIAKGPEELISLPRWKSHYKTQGPTSTNARCFPSARSSPRLDWLTRLAIFFHQCHFMHIITSSHHMCARLRILLSFPHMHSAINAECLQRRAPHGAEFMSILAEMVARPDCILQSLFWTACVSLSVPKSRWLHERPLIVYPSRRHALLERHHIAAQGSSDPLSHALATGGETGQ
jgi:hypothetical protein